MNPHVAQPQTPSAVAAAEMLESAAPMYLANHSYRTFEFGMMLAESPRDIDPEVAFIASVLHDIGLTEAFRGAASFELVGADHAARFLEMQGWDTDRIGHVETAIVRHAELEPLEDPTHRVVQAGAVLDIAGLPVAAIDPPEVADTLARYPRHNFTQNISAAFATEVQAQPAGLFARLGQLVDFDALLAANPLCEHETAGATFTLRLPKGQD